MRARRPADDCMPTLFRVRLLPFPFLAARGTFEGGLSRLNLRELNACSALGALANARSAALFGEKKRQPA